MPLKVLEVEVASLTTMVEVWELMVKLETEAVFQTNPVPIAVQVPEPILTVLATAGLELALI